MAALAVTQLVRASSQSWMMLKLASRLVEFKNGGMVRGKMSDLRLASLVAVISFTGLSWSHGGIVNELQKMLPKAGNDGELLAVLLESVELVSESRLELLTGDVGELGLCNERLCLGTDKFLL